MRQSRDKWQTGSETALRHAGRPGGQSHVGPARKNILFSDPPSKIQTAASPLPPLTESENRKFQILVILSRKIGVRLARKK